MAYGETQALNSNSTSAVQDPQIGINIDSEKFTFMVAQEGGMNDSLNRNINVNGVNNNSNVLCSKSKNRAKRNLAEELDAIDAEFEQASNGKETEQDFIAPDGIRITVNREEDEEFDEAESEDEGKEILAKSPLQCRFYYFVDKCMPFGSSISCAHFQAFSNAISHVMTVKTGKKNVNYLDDFLFIAFLRWVCNQQVQSFLDICSQIPFPVSMEKMVWACMMIVFLGMLIDTE